MFGSNFGAPSTNFGGFNSPSTSSNVFGQSAPVSSSSLFGSTNFNQPPKQTSFGVASPSFGSPQTTMFGQPNRLNGTTSGSMFSAGTTGVASPFSTATSQVQGTSVPFNAITGTDTMMKNGVPAPINTRHQCITCMKEYETKCLEELRFEDYQLGRKGSPQSGMFGATQPQQSTNLFSSMAAGPSTSNTFGQRTTTFGTSSPSGGLFQTLNQPPKTNFFTPTTSSTFGASTFSFSNSGNQTAGMFGQGSNAASGGGTLGANTGFSFSQPQQQPTLSLFGQKPLTPAVTSSATSFPGFGLTQNNTLNKTLPMFGTPTSTTFGTPAPTFGTSSAPSLFGTTAQQPAKPFSFSGFGTTAQPTFGTPGTTAFSFANPASTTNLGFTSTATPSFGTSASTGFAPFGTNTFSLGAPATNTGFGGTSFSFNNPSMSTGYPFASSGVPNQLGQVNVQQQVPPTGPVPFPTTPYKDSPLFYNLITNRNLDDMTKPTNPLALRAVKEASRRRMSSNLTPVGASTNIKNFTFPLSRNHSSNKKSSIFDGFEEENQGSLDDLIRPTNIKALNIVKSPVSNSRPISNGLQSSVSLIANLNESGRFDIDNYEDDTVSRLYTSEGYGEVPSGHSESNATLADSILNQSAGDFNNRFHVPNPELSFNDERDVDKVNRSFINGALNCGVISTRPGYFTHPTLTELDDMTTDNGACFVRGFVIGRHNFGQIRFLETVNVAGINLDEIFFFRHKEVSLYPDDMAKPPVGQGINCAAEIKMERVWPIDKNTREPIRSPTKISALNYEDKLKRSCNRMDAEFISYDIDHGIWIFQVAHFSKYSCVPEENEDDDLENLPPTQVTLTKGLGGIASNELKSGQSGMFPPPQPAPPVSDLTASGDGATTFLKPQNWSARYQSTPTASAKVASSKDKERTQLQDRQLFLGTGDNEIDMDDIDFNPLTPSDYDTDSDKDSVDKPTSGVCKQSLYEPVIRETEVSPKLSLMKSVLSSELGHVTEEDAEQQMRESPPPVKKSRPLRSCLTERKKIPLCDSGKEPQRNKSYLPDSVKTSSLLKGIVTSGLEPKRPPLDETTTGSIRQCRKRDEVKREVNIRGSFRSMFSDLKMCPGSVAARRRGARVSFGPGGHFVRVKAAGTKVSTQVEILRIDSPARMIDPRSPSMYQRAIEEQLYCQFDSQPNVALSGDEFLIEVGGIATAHIQFLDSFSRLKSLRQETSSELLGILMEERQMWSLCKILWAKDAPTFTSDTVFLLKQREKLVKWFQDNSQMLFKDLYNTSDNSLKGSLLRGRKSAACEQAIDEDNLNLALCASQDISHIQESCRNQIEQWRGRQVEVFIPGQNLTVFELCSGIPVWEDLDFRNISTSQWLQHFAIYLWYMVPPHATVQEIVIGYHSLILEAAGADFEEDSFPIQADSSIPNLCIQLLKAFAFTDYPLKIVLNPKTSNPNSLDYKLSWFLMLNIDQFGGFRIDSDLRENVTCGFASQLERLGMFQWAIYAVKHLKPSMSRRNLIKQILLRNIKSGDFQEEEYFLMDALGVDADDILEAKLVIASWEQRNYYEMRYMLHFEKHEEVYAIYLKHFGEYCFTDANIRTWDFTLKSLHRAKEDILEWDITGRCLHSLCCAVKHMNIDVRRRNIGFSNEVRRYLDEVFTSLRRMQPKKASEVLFILQLCIAARDLVNLLVPDEMFELNTDTISRFPPLGLTNVKSLGEYLGELREFFAGLGRATLV